MLDIDDLTTVTLDLAKTRESEFPGFVILFKKSPPHLLMDINFSNDEEKDMLYDTYRFLFQKHDCYAYSMAFEAWYSETDNDRPSLADDRQDCFALTVKDSRTEEFKLLVAVKDEIRENNDAIIAGDNIQLDNPYRITTPKLKIRKLSDLIPKEWLEIEKLPANKDGSLRTH